MVLRNCSMRASARPSRKTSRTRRGIWKSFDRFRAQVQAIADMSERTLDILLGFLRQ